MNRHGVEAEQQAARYLQSHGLKLIHTNYRSRFGEIDLIMQDGDICVFIEVRLRTHAAFGGAAASISYPKQAKIIKTAQHYLTTQKSLPPCRFDAILFNSTDFSQIEWVKNAFSA